MRFLCRSFQWRSTNTILPALAVVVLLGGCQTASHQDRRESISADESPLMFAHPDGTKLQGRFLRVSKADYSRETNYGTWSVGRGTQYPLMRITYFSLGSNRYFTRFDANIVQSYVEGLNFGTRGKPVPGSRFRTRNALSTVEVQRFTLEGQACFGFESVWGDSASGISALGTDRIMGFYCDSETETLSDNRINDVVQSIGIRGHSVPPRVLAAAKSQTRSTNASFRVSLRWTGRYDNVIGRMTATNTQGRDGRIALDLPNNSGTCSGEWRINTGDYKTETKPTGTWKILCSNGVSASGLFSSPQPGIGDGSGIDSEGKAVNFTFKSAG